MITDWAHKWTREQIAKIGMLIIKGPFNVFIYDHIIVIVSEKQFCEHQAVII